MDDNKAALSILSSSLLAGLVYWLVAGGEYMAMTIYRGMFPFDAVLFLVPILLFSVGIGVLVCMPLYLLLKKYDLVKLKLVLPAAIIVSFATVFSMYNQQPSVLYSIAAVLAATCATLMFFKLAGDCENIS